MSDLDDMLAFAAFRHGDTRKAVAQLAAIRAENSRLLVKLREQRNQLAIQNEAAHRKNIALDALHYVWCNGGCFGGHHRFAAHDARVPLTEDIVVAAERNTARLRRWFEHRKLREARARAQPNTVTPTLGAAAS